MKRLQDRRFHDPIAGGLGTCHPNGADQFDVARGAVPREIGDIRLDALRNGTKLLAETGEPIALRTPIEQALAELTFERRDAALHGRLVHAERLGGLNRAPLPRDGEKMAQVVPIEHGAFMRVCPPIWQTCISREVSGDGIISSASPRKKGAIACLSPHHPGAPLSSGRPDWSPVICCRRTPPWPKAWRTKDICSVRTRASI